jgi:large conductance mechanosensitive channel
MGLLREFKEFAMRGNVLDLAVGIIIGAAFTTIVNSFVNDVIMPPLGIVTGGVDFADKQVELRAEQKDPATQKVIRPATYLRYGKFINAVIQFLIVAFSVFLLVKVVNTATKKVSRPPPPGEPTNKECPMCTSSIPYRATKCPQCTADLPAPAVTV